MKKHFILICCLFFLMYSCSESNKKIVDIDNASTSDVPSFCNVIDILAAIDSNLITKEYVIIIPNNACRKCIEYTFYVMPELCQTQHVAVISCLSDKKYNSFNFDCVKTIPANTIERNMEIYGITLIHITANNKSKISYLSPKNLRDEYERITGKTMLPFK